MSRLPGLFNSFDNLDQITPEKIAFWLKSVPEYKILENYLANRILYPQTHALTEFDMQIDLAILREALKNNSSIREPKKTNSLLGDNPFLNTTMRKILIPADFLNFVPNLLILVQVFIDAFLLKRKRQDFFQDLWTIVLTGDIDEVVGSILMPQFDGNGGVIDFKIQNKNYKIQQGNLELIPCPKSRCEIAYKLEKGKLLGKQENAFEVYGGKLGLVVDGRDN